MMPLLKMLPLPSSLSWLPGLQTCLVGVTLAALLWPTAATAQLNCLGLDGPLPAECQSFQFVTRLRDVNDPTNLLGGVSVDQTIVGTMTINTALQDVDPDATRGEYQNAFECVRLEFPDRELLIVTPATPVIGTGSSLIVLDDAPSGDDLVDAFEGLVGGSGTLDLDAQPMSGDVAGQGSASFSYFENCPTSGPAACLPTSISGDAIPSAPGTLGTAFDAVFGADFFTSSIAGTEVATLEGDLQSLDASPPIPCPEPGLGAMLCVGALGLASRRPRRRAC